MQNFLTLAAIRNLIKFFIRDEKGAFAVIFAAMILPLFALAGAAVDYSRASSVKMQMQKAADSAALAGGRASVENADNVYYKSVGNKIFQENMLNAGFANSIKFDIVRITDGVRVDAKTSINTNFLKLVGVPKFNIAVFSEITIPTTNIELVMVLDNTGSMSGSKLASLKNSAKILVNSLMSDVDNEQIKFALVPFAKYVNIGVGSSSLAGINAPASWFGCVGSRNNPLDERDTGYIANPAIGLALNCGVRPLTRLTTNRDVILNDIDVMQASGWTYIAPGLLWGWNLLSDVAPFDDARAYDDGNKKVLVLMTDGSNTASSTYPDHVDPYDTIPSNVILANNKTKDVCENIKGENIIVHTIAFEISNNTIKNIMQNCAGNGGSYFDASNSAELENAFKQIASDVMELRITK